MGQSATSSGLHVAAASATPVSVFPTELGWVAFCGRFAGLEGLVLGYSSDTDARLALATVAEAAWPTSSWEGAGFDGAEFDGDRPLSEDTPPGDWFPDLRRRIEDYAAGGPVDFEDVPVRERPLTAFQRRVLHATRRLQYGQTISYGALAELCGAPRAARAVGSVMSHNRVPLVIPCHRVVGSGGHPGGYSGGSGVTLKRQMLALEALGVGNAASPSCKMSGN